MEEKKAAKISSLPNNSIAVKSALLHQTVNAPGIIGADKTINEVKNPGLKMTWTPQGLLLERQGLKAIIPAANVALAILQED